MNLLLETWECWFALITPFLSLHCKYASSSQPKKLDTELNSAEVKDIFLTSWWQIRQSTNRQIKMTFKMFLFSFLGGSAPFPFPPTPLHSHTTGLAAFTSANLTLITRRTVAHMTHEQALVCKCKMCTGVSLFTQPAVLHGEHVRVWLGRSTQHSGEPC